jgi:phosphocarrier protein
MTGDGGESSGPAPAGARAGATICNRRGLHARAAAKFVKLAEQFAAEIMVRKNGTSVSGRSIMGLMMLAAGIGTEIEVQASGPDAERAVEALVELIRSGFHEE